MAPEKTALHDGVLVRSRLVRLVFQCLAVVCILLGLIGVFLPLLPTTPFLLLAAFFSIRSSPAIHTWLVNHKILGPPLQQYLIDRSITRSVFYRAVSFLWLTISLSICIITLVWVKWLLIFIAVSVTVYLNRLKQRNKS
ncbi:YbaN family protein [uncultured Endozoicomonas sp.]|uniref:YbaN family protein n=1 Tax=uncultured Endozoicomonas sp. TaxID=432652 RepID=UPI002637612C|nr:YbaN family protein [uncultured Endozoicomonas sp.]